MASVAPPVTPVPGSASQVVTGGTPVIAAPAGINGGFITNPATAAGTLFVNPVANATTVANGTTFGLAPGQTWELIAGQTTVTSVNALDDAHDYSVVVW